jgi:DNA-binding LytR/AlgR family response regulator
MMEGNTYSNNAYQSSISDNGLFSSFPGLKKKSRLIVQKGMEFVPLFIRDVVLIFTENKLTFVVDKEGRKYISDKNLADLSTLLDRERFFRANRQYIVNMEYIKSYRSYGKSKLQVEVTLSDNRHSIIISQENAPHFRNWISEA